MDINADLLTEQVKLAYDFIEALHGQAIALIKDVETQLAQEADLRLLRPGGYRYTINPQSYGLERPQVPVADYFAVFFRQFEGRVTNTPFDGAVPPIGFLKVVFRERGLKHPETRFGVLTNIKKPLERTERYPQKVEDIVGHLADRAIVGTSCCAELGETRTYEHSYVTLRIEARAVRLVELPDSEAIAERIVDPLLVMFRDAN